ncbi:MAG: NIPSNAP family protein [Alphaproteobacteria bacterium]|nr:NIPSNAP family protein [Alphaproteobacteria bacterium]
MLFDVRKYTCRPGTIGKHLELYEKMGKAPQAKHLGQPVLYAKCETGDPNCYIHIWAYESAGDRETKRAAMWSDPDWIAYTQESAKLGALEKQENSLFNDVSFYPYER